MCEAFLLLAGPRPPHDERKRGQTGHNERHHPKAVFKAKRARLLLHSLVGHSHRFLRRSYRVISLRKKHPLKPVQKLLEIEISVACMRGEGSLVSLILPR
jgi:hypothetical protein